MEDAAKGIEGTDTAEGIGSMEKDDLAMRLLTAMLAGEVLDVRPQLDFTAEAGFTYPSAEYALKTTSHELVPVLESLAAKGILKRDFFERMLRCPRCRSVNLRPSVHCPKCGSSNIVRGRVLEHPACKYVGIEDEFAVKGKLICPKCRLELRTAGSDYQSMGLLRKCRACSEVFSMPLIKWRCLKCSSLVDEEEVSEVNVFSYTLDEAKRGWLQFELEPKSQFIEFLKQHGYEVTRNARVRGKSGGEHTIDILASRDDGLVTHDIAIGVEVVGARIGLDRIFDFDSKAYDSGFHDKMLIVIPALAEEAQKYAGDQRIKVLQVRDLETVLASSTRPPGQEAAAEPFHFESRSQVVQYLQGRGYEVKENAVVHGRSGASHSIDILATRDDGVITHRIAIGTAVSDKPVGLDTIFRFDDKAYDIGIPDKVFIAVPGLNKEAKEFARRQRIKVLEVKELEPAHSS
jgi:hypothetical protein